MSVTKKISILCLGVGLALSMSSVTFAAQREPSRTELPEVCCEPDTCAVTCFSGHVAVDPCRKLLANFIDPVVKREGECHPAGPDNTRAVTCFSGNIGVNPKRALWVNTIRAVTVADVECPAGDMCPPEGCIGDAEGCVTIVNPLLKGRVCFDSKIGTFGNCSDKQGVLTNFIWPAKPDRSTDKAGCVIEDDCGVTCFQGNAAMNPCRQFRTNYIVPVQDNTHKNSSEVCCDEFDCGTTTFQGNAGMDECRMFLTNFICPTKNVNDPNCDYDPCGSKDKASPNTSGTTNFSGDIGLDCRRKLLVNRIDPVRSRRKETTNDCLAEGFCLLEAEVDSDPEAITCFSGNVGIDGTKCLLVNRIGPVAETEGEDPFDDCPEPGALFPDCPPACKFNPTGCLELHGAKVIVPNTLLVNDLCPYNCDNRADFDEVAVMNLRSNVNIDRTLEVAGDLILDGHNIGDVVEELQKAYAQVQVELAQLRSMLNN